MPNLKQRSSQDKPLRFDRRLIAGLDDDGIGEFGDRWQGATEVRRSVAGALTKSLDSAILQSESREVFDSPNALAALADLAGYRRGLREAIKLLSNQDQS